MVKERAAAVAPYARQLLDDENVRSVARQAARATGAAYRRARGQDVGDAVKDKQLRRRVAEATQSVGRLWIAGTEPPPKPKRRLRSAVVLILAAAAVAALLNEQVRVRLLAALSGKPPTPESSPSTPMPESSPSTPMPESSPSTNPTEA